MHVYKMKTQSKENFTEQHYKFQSLQSTDTAADCCRCGEKRWDHPLSRVFIFVDISVQWSRAKEERHWEWGAFDQWHCGKECGKTGPPPPNIPLLPHTPNRAPLSPQELCIQTWLQNLDVLTDGYEAEVSVMMERIRKTRKHSRLLTHTPPPPPPSYYT